MRLFQKSVVKNNFGEYDFGLKDKKFTEFQDYFADIEREEIKIMEGDS